MLKGKNGNAYNIGSGKLTSNIDLINRILKKNKINIESDKINLKKNII